VSTALFFEAEFWVGAAFVIFLILIWRAGAHRSVASGLDEHSKRASKDLEEARRLKEEAQALLTEYKKKQREAESQASAIVAQAKVEAEEIAAEAKTRMEEFVARRTKMAEAKIAQADVQALADVRAAAAEAAVKASEKVLSESVKGKVASDLLSAAIRDVKTRLD
jgi:F-type H+-transporting ATPase subunit b